MVKVSQEEFLETYSRFLKSVNNKKDGSVFLTFKRYLHNEANTSSTTHKGDSKVKTEGQGAGESETIATTSKTSTKSKQSTKKSTKTSEKPKSSAKKTVKPKAVLTGEPVLLAHVKLADKDYSCIVKADEAAKFQTQFNTIYRVNTAALVPPGGTSERLKKRQQASKKGAVNNKTKTKKTTDDTKVVASTKASTKK